MVSIRTVSASGENAQASAQAHRPASTEASRFIPQMCNGKLDACPLAIFQTRPHHVACHNRAILLVALRNEFSCTPVQQRLGLIGHTGKSFSRG
jgi:hypothetical protein